MAPAAGYRAGPLAELCGVSSRCLRRQFHDLLGRPPQAWLNELRLLSCGQSLRHGAQIKRVALEHGFKQVSHFCRQFKAAHGMTPSDFVAFYCPQP